MIIPMTFGHSEASRRVGRRRLRSTQVLATRTCRELPESWRARSSVLTIQEHCLKSRLCFENRENLFRKLRIFYALVMIPQDRLGEEGCCVLQGRDEGIETWESE